MFKMESQRAKIDFSDPNSFPGSQDLHPKWRLFWSNFRQNKTQQIGTHSHSYIFWYAKKRKKTQL